MFLNVRVKNFRSLSDFEFNLVEKKGQYKKLALIYGENGSGKTNVVSIFSALVDTFYSMEVKKFIEDMLSNSEELPPERFVKKLNASIPSVETVIKRNKTIGNDENMLMEFDFMLNGQVGTYILELNNDSVVYEKLEYLIEKQKGTMFELSIDHKQFHPKIFHNQDYLMEISNMVDKFWGKHTFFSLLCSEGTEKNVSYLKNNIHKNLLEITNSFLTVHCYGERTSLITIASNSNIPLEGEYLEGDVPVAKTDELELSAKLLTHIFSGLYSDIKELYYKTERNGESVMEYELFLKKRIGGTIRDIPFKIESSGTKRILNLIAPLFYVMQGNVVVIDEFDNGIHDVMVRELFEEFTGSISGQLIITTHNTFLLETNIENKYLYVLKVDEDGHKKINSLDKGDSRIHQNHNRRTGYLKGFYEGIPLIGYLDFDLVLSELTDGMTKSEENHE